MTRSPCFFSARRVSRIFSTDASRAPRGLITNFGILMDPLADKIMTCSAFIAFVESTHLRPDAPVKVAAWMVIIIVARELAITGLRLLAASKGRRAGGGTVRQTQNDFADRRHHRAARDRRQKRMACVVAKYFPGLVGGFTEIALWLTVALTAASGLIYLWRNREIYLSDL
jgi:CDP-diacylglycerol--glycerol-3-phosphate 3-phosphatidyltransferase